MVTGVPVPFGVTTTAPIQDYINDGPGFTSAKFAEVSQRFATNLSCSDLEAAWEAALATLI